MLQYQQKGEIGETIMKNDDRVINIIKNFRLFKGVDLSEIPNMLKFFNAHIKTYQNGEIISNMWEPINEAGLILNGSVIIKFLSSYGGEHRINKVMKNGVFGLSFASNKSGGDSVEVISAEKTEILFLNFSNLFLKPTNSCVVGQVGINLLRELAGKNVHLNKKVEILSHHRIRDRVVVYLKSISKGKKIFNISLNREEMASFLGVERSALSRELSKMKNENLIEFSGNKFSLLDSHFFEEF